MITFTEIESILLNAVKISDNSIKTIAEATGIKVNTLYKWKTTDVHLSPSKADALLEYFRTKEPLVLLTAEIVRTVQILLFINSVFSSEEEVTE